MDSGSKSPDHLKQSVSYADASKGTNNMAERTETPERRRLSMSQAEGIKKMHRRSSLDTPATGSPPLLPTAPLSGSVPAWPSLPGVSDASKSKASSGSARTTSRSSFGEASEGSGGITAAETLDSQRSLPSPADELKERHRRSSLEPSPTAAAPSPASVPPPSSVPAWPPMTTSPEQSKTTASNTGSTSTEPPKPDVAQATRAAQKTMSPTAPSFSPGIMSYAAMTARNLPPAKPPLPVLPVPAAEGPSRVERHPYQPRQKSASLDIPISSQAQVAPKPSGTQELLLAIDRITSNEATRKANASEPTGMAQRESGSREKPQDTASTTSHMADESKLPPHERSTWRKPPQKSSGAAQQPAEARKRSPRKYGSYAAVVKGQRATVLPTSSATNSQTQPPTPRIKAATPVVPLASLASPGVSPAKSTTSSRKFTMMRSPPKTKENSRPKTSAEEERSDMPVSPASTRSTRKALRSKSGSPRKKSEKQVTKTQQPGDYKGKGKAKAADSPSAKSDPWSSAGVPQRSEDQWHSDRQVPQPSGNLAARLRREQEEEGSQQQQYMRPGPSEAQAPHSAWSTSSDEPAFYRGVAPEVEFAEQRSRNMVVGRDVSHQELNTAAWPPLSAPARIDHPSNNLASDTRQTRMNTTPILDPMRFERIHTERGRSPRQRSPLRQVFGPEAYRNVSQTAPSFQPPPTYMQRSPTQPTFEPALQAQRGFAHGQVQQQIQPYQPALQAQQTAARPIFELPFHTQRSPAHQQIFPQAFHQSRTTEVAGNEGDRESVRASIRNTEDELWHTARGWDVLIRCRGIEFKVHRDILTSHSEWFADCLPPARAPYVEINCHKHHFNDLGWVLWFMYHHYYPNATVPTHDPLNGDCIRRTIYMYLCGASVRCAELQNFAVRAMDDVTRFLTDSLEYIYRNPELRRLYEPLREGLGMLYGQGNNGDTFDMRLAVARLLDVSMVYLCKHQEFRSHFMREWGLVYAVVEWDNVLFRLMGKLEEPRQEGQREARAAMQGPSGGNGDEEVSDEGTIVGYTTPRGGEPEGDDDDVTPRAERTKPSYAAELSEEPRQEVGTKQASASPSKQRLERQIENANEAGTGGRLNDRAEHEHDDLQRAQVDAGTQTESEVARTAQETSRQQPQLLRYIIESQQQIEPRSGANPESAHKSTQTESSSRQARRQKISQQAPAIVSSSGQRQIASLVENELQVPGYGKAKSDALSYGYNSAQSRASSGYYTAPEEAEMEWCMRKSKW